MGWYRLRRCGFCWSSTPLPPRSRRETRSSCIGPYRGNMTSKSSRPTAVVMPPGSLKMPPTEASISSFRLAETELSMRSRLESLAQIPHLGFCPAEVPMSLPARSDCRTTPLPQPHFWLRGSKTLRQIFVPSGLVALMVVSFVFTPASATTRQLCARLKLAHRSSVGPDIHFSFMRRYTHG